MNEPTGTAYAAKGSKRMIQILVNEHSDLINKALNDKLDWYSPIAKDDFKEYQLNGSISRKLGLKKGFLEGFWPSRSPVWDGIAVAGKTLYLFEAKSHLDEISSGNKMPQTDKQKDNYRIKTESIKHIACDVYGVTDAACKAWLHEYYQISNRLVFLHKMKELSHEAIYKDVKLVFLNFVNDSTWEENIMVKKAEDWDKKFETIFKEMGNIASKVQENGLSVLNIDAQSWIILPSRFS
jgi:hypothetical protein